MTFELELLHQLIGELLIWFFILSFAAGFSGALFFSFLEALSEAISQKDRRITAARARAKVEAWKASRVAG